MSTKMKNKLEFKKGDIVYWKGWESEPIRAKVIEAKMSRMFFRDCLEPVYKLEGAEQGGITRSLVTVTTGRSIIESRHFRDFLPDKNDSWAKYYKPLSKDFHHLIKPGYAWKALKRQELEQ